MAAPVDLPASRDPRTPALSALLVALSVLVAAPAGSATAADEPEPLQCWWRTSVSAVKVGEPFTLVLTCAALQTESLSAVVDRARLDPRAIELAPFEVLGGSRAPDLRAGDRVFFQNQYTLRFINDAFFSQDVPLPALSVSYRIQTRAASRDASTQGMERRFAMPRETVRITSLVPGEAADIRDAAAITFAEVDALSSRGRLFTTTGAILAALGALVALIGVGRAVGQRVSAPAAEAGLIGDASILRGVGRELAAVRRDRDGSGWTVDLVARALAASRIVAEHALSRTASQRLAGARGPVPAGALLLRRRWRGGEAVLVSGSATPKTLALELTQRATAEEHAPPRLEELRQSLTAFTQAEYGDEGPLAEAVLDESLSTVERLARRLALEQSWPMRRLTPLIRRRSGRGRSR